MKKLSSLALLLIGHTSTLAMLAICRESARETDEKRCSSECARPGGLRRLGGDRVSSQLPQLPSKKVVIVDAPKGTTSSSAEENFGFWIDEPTKIVTFAVGRSSMSAALMTTGSAL